MDNLAQHIARAKYIAAEREGDIRIKEFLRALRWENRGEERIGASQELRGAFTIECHARSWRWQLTREETASALAASDEALATMMAGWVSEALKRGLLSLSNPPLTGAAEPMTVGAAYTFIYDPERGFVGTRWESRGEG